MSTAYNDFFAKLREATVLLLNSNAPGYTILDGGTNPVIDAPYAVVYAENTGEEDPPNTGNYWANFQCEIYYNAPTDTDGVNPKAGFDLMTATIFDVLQNTNFPFTLNGLGVTDFTAQGIRQRNTGFHIVGDQWVNVWSAQIICCPSTVYP